METVTVTSQSHADIPDPDRTWGDLSRDELETLAATDYPAAPIAQALLEEKPDGF